MTGGEARVAVVTSPKRFVRLQVINRNGSTEGLATDGRYIKVKCLVSFLLFV